MSQETSNVLPINGSATSDSKPKQTRTKPNYVLPTDRISCDKQLTLLRGYAAVSGHNKKPAKINDVAEASKISATTISLANGFFIEIGLLLKSDAGFVPADEVAAFALAHEWGPDAAPKKLAPIIRASWFAERVMPRISMNPVHENDLIDVLSMAAGVGKDFRPRVKLLLDWLVASGVAEREGDSLRKSSLAIEAPASSAAAPDKATPIESREPAPQRDPVPSRVGVRTDFAQTTGITQMTGGSVHFNVSVKVDMADFKDWRSDRIAAFFGGIAAVLAAKADIEKAASDD